MSGKWNIHNSLRLRLTRIADIPDTLLSKNAFHILNPVKSFVVHADSRSSKASWMRDIQGAIADAHNRTYISNRRLSKQASTTSEEELGRTLADIEDENKQSQPSIILGFLSESLN